MRIDDSDRHRIQTAVAAAEQRTGVHIATSIVPASDHYALYPLVWGGMGALLLGGILAFASPTMPLRESFAIQAAAFLVLSLLFDWWPVRLFLVPRHVRRARASAMAHREFAAHILAHGSDKGGALLFVSLGERYAEVLGDRTLHARIGDEGWNAVVAELVAGARSGRPADGIIKAIEVCEAKATSGT